MASRTPFTGFEPFTLTGVTLTDRKLGHGSYATVQELQYMGLKCAGKKIHDLLLEQGDTSYTLRRFEEECRLLSQVRHPNIVQFLGVFFQQGVRVPILVMEYLPTNLTSCIEQYGIFPKEISYSILHNVSLGLCYLHSQTPPIIHRDLSSNNVLLTASMTAKISDLGVARILNLTPLQVSRMTQTPGTPAYMPPEVMVANPRYDTSLDDFSYGILMIHMFSGRWPEPQVGPNRMEEGRLIPVTEAERREVFLRAIGNEHPLMDLILRCVNNDPLVRPRAGVIVERLAAMVLQFPASFANRLEMLRHFQQLEEEMQALREEKEVENCRHQEEMSSLREKAQETEHESVHQNLIYSSEIEQLRRQVRDLNTRNQLLKTKYEADNSELSEKLAICQAQQVGDQDVLQTQIADQYEAQMTGEREHHKSLTNDHVLQAEISQLRMSSSSLEHKISTLEAEQSTKDATIERKETELEAQSRALEEKDSIITEMSQELARTKECLTSKRLAETSITWQRCADLPTSLSGGKATVINDKVYCGGVTNDVSSDCIVYRYDPSTDHWTTLPPLPVTRFGLGQMNGKLVAVGGMKKGNKGWTNEVYTYNVSEDSRKWKQTIPPMSTARHSPGVLSLQSALVVAGGCVSTGMYTNAVEIFKSNTLQWYTTDPLPTPCYNVTLTKTGKKCYVVGGYKQPSHLNQALSISIDDLLDNALPANQTTRNGINMQTMWKSRPSTPTYQPTAVVLAGKLLAIGGREVSDGGPAKKGVYVYSPFNNSWICISELPVPLYLMAVTVLPSTADHEPEILVIGGWCDGKVSAVYKGILELKLCG